MESNIFSFQRFCALLVRYWVERKGQLFLLWALTFLIGFAYLYYQQKLNMKFGYSFVNVFSPVFFLGLPTFMFLHLTIAFGELKEKHSLVFMTLPASKMERFIFLFCTGLLFPLLVYMITLWVVDWGLYYYFKEYTSLIVFNSMNLKIDAYVRQYSLLVIGFGALVIFLHYFILKKNQLLLSLSGLGLGYVIVNYLNHELLERLLGTVAFGGECFGALELNYEPDLLKDRGLILDYPQYSIPLLVLFASGLIYAAYLKFGERQVKL